MHFRSFLKLNIKKCHIQKQLLLDVAVPIQPLQCFLKQTTYNCHISNSRTYSSSPLKPQDAKNKVVTILASR